MVCVRLRLGCRGLKVHLHYNLHVEDDPYCRCGRVIEDPAHYLLYCPFFQDQRTLLLYEITQIVIPSLYILDLYGDETLSINDNIRIVLLVQTFIETTKRLK